MDKYNIYLDTFNFNLTIDSEIVQLKFSVPSVEDFKALEMFLEIFTSKKMIYSHALTDVNLSVEELKNRKANFDLASQELRGHWQHIVKNYLLDDFIIGKIGEQDVKLGDYIIIDGVARLGFELNDKKIEESELIFVFVLSVFLTSLRNLSSLTIKKK